ncbi:MAG: TatD DNase family protein, partial [Gaiellaceae bacterium]|nr:TatD DNase family protein [Gaiellaceae bacterium]
FIYQLGLAKEAQLPVVIHNRASDDDTVSILKQWFDGTVVLHCFSSVGLLDEAIEQGWYVSFAGNVTYKNADDLRTAARVVPAERILAETDCPYLSPQPVRGKTNEPAFVVHTVAALAEARGDDTEALGAQIDANATAAFGLP